MGIDTLAAFLLALVATGLAKRLEESPGRRQWHFFCLIRLFLSPSNRNMAPHRTQSSLKLALRCGKGLESRFIFENPTGRAARQVLRTGS